MRRLCSIALIFAVLALPATGWATRTTEKDVICPVDGTTVTGTLILSSNNFGGFDRDLCPHSRGGSPFLVQMATCSTCGYSAPTAQFERDIDEKTAARIKKELGPPKGPLAPHEQWARHARILTWQKAEPLDVAEAWIMAGWSVRLAFSAQVKDPELAKVQEKLVTHAANEIRARKEQPEAYEAELAVADTLLASVDSGSIAKKQRALARLTAAGIYRSRGEDARASSLLDATGRLPRGELTRLASELRASIELEHRYLERALPQLELGLANPKTDRREIPQATFIAAEIARRLGQKNKARGWYEQAREHGHGSDPRVLGFIERGLEELE